LLNVSGAYSSGDDMNLSDLIELLGRRTVALRNQRTLLDGLGDIEGVIQVDAEVAETEQLIAQLESL
jgi:hypothetical protein